MPTAINVSQSERMLNNGKGDASIDAVITQKMSK